MKQEIYQKENGFPPVKCLAELHSPVSSDFVTVSINNERHEYHNIDKTTLKEIVEHKIFFSKPTKVLEEMLEALEPLKKKLEKEPLPPVCSEKYTDCLTKKTSCGLIDEDGDCFVKKWYRLCDLYALEQKPNNPEERVNHPKHYQHPSGIECITIARHHDFNIGNALKYIWRAGLKQEQGLTPIEKQIEDLQKAVFYIQDEIQFLQAKQKEQ